MAIIWAIVGIIGIVIVILASSPPWFLSLGEIIGLFGLMGSWITVLTGATIEGQREMTRLQKETIKLQRETIELLKESRSEISSSFKEIGNLLSS